MAKTLSLERLTQRQANFQRASQLFERLGGRIIDDFPVIDARVCRTKEGTYYLQEPGVALISMPRVGLGTLRGFLESFDSGLGFGDYLDDEVKLNGGTQLAKVAGQVCYLSFDANRTKNSQAAGYIEDIKESGHGSVLEHINFSFLLYGISRSLTHEHVRHRAGVAISQTSQRYVGGNKLRFVERPEYQNNKELHRHFERRIDICATEYEELTDILEELQVRHASQILSGETKTDRRKKVRQTSRSILPNETESPMVWTANARALHHIFMMRGSEHAETEIRRSTMRIFLCSIMTDPILFSDIEVVDLPDGTHGLTSPYGKP